MNTITIRRTMTLLSALAVAATGPLGCTLASPSDSRSVPSFSNDVIYFSVAPPTGSDDSPTVEGFRRAYGGQVLVLDAANDDDPKIMCSHTDDEIPAKYDEMKDPPEETCALPDASAEGDGAGASPGAGKQGLPPGIGNDWSGYGKGGCGTWSTVMCNRILGDTNPQTAVSKDEWDSVASAIKQDANGASSKANRAAYYRSKGYCTVDRKFDGTGADYDEMTQKLNVDECDVKLSFYTRIAEGKYTNGHVETVTGATHGGAKTNSWGKDATIQGGSNGGFDHSEDGAGKQFHDASGQKLWPKDGTEVWVSYVCKCSRFERLINRLQ